jgi:hypothetical protein
MDLEPTKAMFSHGGWSYCITCFYVKDDPHPTFRFIVDKQQRDQSDVVSDSLLSFSGAGAPNLNAMTVMRPLLDLATERIGDRIRAGQEVPLVLDSSFWR